MPIEPVDALRRIAQDADRVLGRHEPVLYGDCLRSIRKLAIDAIHESKPPQITHAEGCSAWGPAHYQCAQRRIAEQAGEIARLRNEIEMLRRFGNKDCTAMADEAIAAEGKV